MPRVFGRDARKLTFRGADEIAALHAEFLDDQPDLSANDRSTIFRAGVLGESPPACFYEAFDCLLEERRTLRELESKKRHVPRARRPQLAGH